MKIPWTTVWTKFDRWGSDEEKNCTHCGHCSRYASWSMQKKKIQELVETCLKRTTTPVRMKA